MTATQYRSTTRGTRGGALLLGALAWLLSLGGFPAQASIGLPSPAYGIGIGNSPDFTGLRINLSDRRVQRVTGVNLTFWKAGRMPGARIDGLALGLVGPRAARLRGIAAGGAFVRGDHLAGLFLAGGGLAAEKSLTGVAVAGIGMGTGDDMHGIALAGIGVGGGGSMTGVVFGGVGVGAGDDIRGVCVGGLGVGAGRDAAGLLIGGLGVGAGESIRGLTIAGLGAGAGERIRGITVAGLGLGAGRSIDGIAITPGMCRAEELRGLIVGGAYTRALEATGVTCGGWCRTDKRMTGISIAIVNTTPELRGVQLGLLNHAGNNAAGLRWLPGLNLHFE